MPALQQFCCWQAFCDCGGRAREASDLVRWVWANGKPVDDVEWRSLAADPRRAISLYELKVAD